jgi:hypothetical protein
MVLIAPLIGGPVRAPSAMNEKRRPVRSPTDDGSPIRMTGELVSATNAPEEIPYRTTIGMMVCRERVNGQAGSKKC